MQRVSRAIPDLQATAVLSTNGRHKLKGFKSLASIAYAIQQDGSPDDFVRKLWPPAAGSSEAIVSPAAAFARRLVVQTQAVAHPPAPPAPVPGPSLPSAPAAKISAAAAETMREKCITDYPGELLSPANTPSVEFLNRLRSELDAPTSLWIPWRLRTSESDLQHFPPAPFGRTGVPDPVVAQSSAPTSGPVEPTLRRHLGLLTTAFAFLGDLHLRAGKMLLEAFVAAAVEQPIDTTLRPPSMQEVIAAERTVWSNVATLMRDEKWSLPDSVTEITVTRHMLPNILVARPRSIPAPPVREPGLRNLDRTRPEDAPERPPKKPRPTPKGKAKAEAKATGKKPISELWDDSWHSVDESGKEICRRFCVVSPTPCGPCPPTSSVTRPDAPLVVGPLAPSDTRARPRSPRRTRLGFSFSFVPPRVPLGRRIGCPAPPTQHTVSGPPPAPETLTQTLPEPVSHPAPCKHRLFLDLFSGSSAPLSRAVAALGLDRISPIDCLHGEHVDLLDPDTQTSLRRLCSSGLIAVAAAAPPCSSFSRSRLRPGGPPAVRTPAHPSGIPRPSPRQQAELDSSDRLHTFTRELLTLVMLAGGIAILENPASSLLWLVPGCRSWIRHHCMHSVEVAACSHALDYRKSWLFVSNFSDLRSLASVCQHPPGSHATTSGRRTASGAFLTRDTACYPSSLCSALADLFKPLLSSHTGEIPFRSWHSLLPATLFWPIPANRVEDGAGTCSSASWSVPRGADCFGSLRKAWCARILSGDFLSKFQAKLSSGSKAPPLSDPELAPFLDDLRSFLRLSAPDFDTLLSVPPGQPFRLFLLEALLSVFKDPDTSFVDLLTEGVPLGVDSEMPSCPTLFPPAGQSAPTMDLTHCSSSWGSALSDQASVDSLLSEEISEGWVREIPGGLDELTARYQQTAVGKLGLVKSPGRPDRLVVDSSVSGVTEHTSLPNKSANPSISGIRQCLPPEHAIEWLIALILDVSKAHRRIKIRDSDRGLLCFFHRNRLYQCLTLNFGARASGFYWSRMAGLLTRLLHRLVFVKHCLLIYVDDLIALLSGPSGPVWAALMCIMLLILRVPMSWHKAYLGPRPTWIGWSICLHSLSATMEAPKLDRLRDLLAKIRGSDSVPLHLLRKLTGKLLWVCSLFRPFRPSLAPLYSDQGKPPVVHVALSPAKWASFRSKLDSHLVLQSDVGLASCPKLCTLISVSGREVSSLSQVPVSFPGERRTWISVRMPPESDRKLSKESLAVLDMWHACLADAPPTFPLPLAREFPCQAFADACADAQHAGIGGFVTLPSGKTAWFQHRFSASELTALFPWFPVGTSPQACIAAWELLGQIALLWVIGLLIPVSLHPIHVVTRCDNSPSDSASWKGLSTARGICSLLPAYFAWQRAFCISTYIDHVPGFQNTVADGLSRGADPTTFGLRPGDRVDIPWALISLPPRPSYHPSSALNLSLFPAMDF
ncbi:unnamed protein product [Symbiodinium sp. CCMP2592]|nr:unnamed protein product [Symbiodinium sp. CCMP2592]